MSITELVMPIYLLQSTSAEDVALIDASGTIFRFPVLSKREDTR
jgi:hypothetical protein